MSLPSYSPSQKTYTYTVPMLYLVFEKLYFPNGLNSTYLY